VEKLQIDLNSLGGWAFENEIKINPSKSTAICFKRAQLMEPLNYSLGDKAIMEASSCKCLGIILHSDLSWADQVKRHFILQCVFLKGETTLKVTYTYITSATNS
jgi:hypothetical protein